MVSVIFAKRCLPREIVRDKEFLTGVTYSVHQPKTILKMLVKNVFIILTYHILIRKKYGLGRMSITFLDNLIKKMINALSNLRL